LADLDESLANIDLKALVETLIGDAPETVIVTTPKFYAAFDSVINEENMPLIRDWMLVHSIRSLAEYCSSDAIAILGAFSNLLTGQTEPIPPNVTAFAAVRSLYSEVVGLYYGEKYFGPEAKADVTAMVEQMIETYRERLTANTWLSEETRIKALRKLDTMALQIGYPDKIDPLYDELLIDSAAEGGTYAGNLLRIQRLAIQDMMDRFYEESDRDLWIISADTVNAMYNPQMNSIVFPSAILQAPFYSLSQSESMNYGGIGAVIAHEISHAFDPNGAKFDENGAMTDWWLPEDYAKFEELSQRMVEVFDGLPYKEFTVNGTLTLGENVADAGGLGCALQVVQSLPEPDLQAFFINWATIWRQKTYDQVEGILITIDTHAPNKIRANLQPAMLDAFYEAFDIIEGDPMYRAPEDRVAIW
jgi:putative endopeptidase